QTGYVFPYPGRTPLKSSLTP
ncbi:hypothetical protein AZ019_005373, partial [Klebsiella pneumoniae]